MNKQLSLSELVLMPLTFKQIILVLAFNSWWLTVAVLLFINKGA